jgi:hypothetical protein
MEGIDKNTFKRIFYDHWNALKQPRPRFDKPDYNETVNKMLGCGDPENMGSVQYRCCYCGERAIGSTIPAVLVTILIGSKISLLILSHQPNLGDWLSLSAPNTAVTSVMTI